MAILFGVPILLSVALVYFLSPDWYTKISQKVPGVIVPLLLAVILSIVFFSFGRMHFKWEMNEQLYKELKMKKEQEESNAANQVKN